MNYFDNFPKIMYDFSTDKQDKFFLATDITRNVRFRKEILGNISLYEEYDIKDGETPEIIAEKVYGSPFYHWIVMLANEKYNWIEDYPLSSRELDEYIAEKYGSVQTAMNTVKYYKNLAGDVVYYNPNSPALSYSGEVVAVKCYEYEMELNESKRRIKIISPSIINVVLSNFRDSMA